MVYCPKCKTELEGSPAQCYVCGADLESEEEAGWMMLGTVEDKPFADLARETLKSLGIPAAVISSSGFFGNAGLPLNPFYKPRAASFEVRVPTAHAEEADALLEATLGEKWHREEQ